MDIQTLNHTLTIGILAQLVGYLRHLGVDVSKMFHSIDVDPDILKVPDNRISVDTYIRVEEAAAQASGDPYFGLHMGEFYEAGNWSILGYLLTNCQTLGEAMIKAGKYSKVIGTLIHTTAFIKDRKIVIIFSTDKNAPSLSRHCFEAALSSTIKMVRDLCKTDIDPVEVGFMTPIQPLLDEYTRVFRSTVRFSQKHCYLVLPAHILDLPVVGPNAGLMEFFEDYVQNYLADIHCIRQFTMEVAKRIMAVLDSTNISIGRISREMAMSRRNLQNHLKEEDTSYRQILENTRVMLAKKYLKEDHTVEDITFMLGFKDISVFRRTFKKWTGCTPSEYRQSANSP